MYNTTRGKDTRALQNKYAINVVYTRPRAQHYKICTTQLD